jgi:cytochrome c peroxidase
MLRKLLIAVFGVLVAGYLGLTAYAYFHDARHATQSASRPASSPENARIRTLLDRKACYYCHSSTTPLPAYAALPGIDSMSKHDVETGLRHFRIDAVIGALNDGTAPPETDLAKLETVVDDGSMPPARFVALHWGAGFSDSERRELLAWIGAQRRAHYAAPDVSPAFVDEPVQPLPKSIPTDPAKVALGLQLFHDPRLSKDNSVSCASCHSLAQGGADGRKSSLGVGGQIGPINAPTVYNAVLNHTQFWDGRAANLQEQAGGPPLNPVEMASSSWQEIIAKFEADPDFTQRFLAVYPDGYSDKNLTGAIAEFEKTLLTPSRFDAYLRGEKNVLSAEERRGYQLFKANRCASCHTGQNFGGQSFERMGLKADYFADRGTPLTAADDGRMNVTKDPSDRYRFKVPTLRNVELTAPYFHDGSSPDLPHAVRAMLKYQVGTNLPDSDVAAIVAFLKTLTGTQAR